MNKFEVFNDCKARIQNQLRIHWRWLRKKSWEEAFEFIETCMNQATEKDDANLKQSESEGKKSGN